MAKLKPKECQNVEYKESWHDKYLAWICRFANAQGAVMYFGVNDEHEIIGLDNVDRLMEDIPNKIVTTMVAAIRKYVRALSLQDCPCQKLRISVEVSGCHSRGKM